MIQRRYPSTRPRRMRRDAFSRALMRESTLTTDDLIYPVFVHEDGLPPEPVPSSATMGFATSPPAIWAISGDC